MMTTPPHEYIPAGPLEAEPPGSSQRPSVRRDAFAAVLAGVETGAYDEKVIAWLASLDDATCRAMASLLWRCRLAGSPDDAHAGVVQRARDLIGSLSAELSDSLPVAADPAIMQEMQDMIRALSDEELTALRAALRQAHQ